VRKKLNLNDKIDLKIELEEKLFLPVDIVDMRDESRLIEREAKKGVKI
jgi:hypothetical protein